MKSLAALFLAVFALAPSSALAQNPGSPVTTITTEPTTYTQATSVSWSWSAAPAATSFQCQLWRNGTLVSGWSACSSGDTFDTTTEGTYSFYVRGTNASGTGLHDLGTVYVDRTAPTETMIGGSDTDAEQTVSFYTGEWQPVTFSCSIDEGAWVACGSGNNTTWTTPALPDGPHTLDVRATDAAGNTQATASRFQMRVDTTAPTLSWAGPAATTDATEGVFEWTPSEGISGVECRLDGGDEQLGCYRFKNLAPGEHTLVFWTWDYAGNRSQTYTHKWTVVAPPTPPTPPTPPVTPKVAVSDFAWLKALPQSKVKALVKKCAKKRGKAKSKCRSEANRRGFAAFAYRLDTAAPVTIEIAATGGKKKRYTIKAKGLAALNEATLRKALPKGSYTATIVAGEGAAASAPSTIAFRVKA